MSAPVNILLLYGSQRGKSSLSRKAVMDAGHFLLELGANVRLYTPENLPLPHIDKKNHKKVKQLQEDLEWCDGMLWCSPEIHTAMSSTFKTFIDWFDLESPPKAIARTNGKTVAFMEICGQEQSFNVTNSFRQIASRLGLIATPGEISIAKAQNEFNLQGLKADSPYKVVLQAYIQKFYRLSQVIKSQRTYINGE